MQVTDQILWDFIDDNLPSHYKSEIEKIVNSDDQVKGRLNELLQVHDLLKSAIKVEKAPATLENKIFAKIHSSKSPIFFPRPKIFVLLILLPSAIFLFSIFWLNSKIMFRIPPLNFTIEGEYITPIFLIILLFAYSLFLLQYMLYKIKLSIVNSNGK